jgi:hypothetical protein
MGSSSYFLLKIKKNDKKSEMNIIQLQYNLEFLLDVIRKQNQEEIKLRCLKVIHLYSIYLIGNRNYLKQYQENKITIFGILDQLISDVCHTLNNQYGPGCVPAQVPPAVPPVPLPPAIAAPVPPAPLPPAPLPPVLTMNVIQSLCDEMSKLAYGQN